MRYDRVVLVTRRTVLQDLVLRFQTRAQARFYLEHAGEDFAGIEAAHERYTRSVQAARAALPDSLKQHVIDRDLLPQYRFEPTDIVVTLGPDGVVANVAKYLGGIPLVPVNPDPLTVDGLLARVSVSALPGVLGRALEGRAEERRVTMAEARLADGQALLAVNDLFVGARTHVSARYAIAAGPRHEEQSSSGIIVSTGVGSTGWLRSIVTGAFAIVQEFGVRAPLPEGGGVLPWDADRLAFHVREPFPSRATQASLVRGAVTPETPLVLTSRMPAGGVIFSDGIESDALEFNSGATATIGIAAQKACLIVA